MLRRPSILIVAHALLLACAENASRSDESSDCSTRASPCATGTPEGDAEAGLPGPPDFGCQQGVKAPPMQGPCIAPSEFTCTLLGDLCAGGPQPGDHYYHAADRYGCVDGSWTFLSSSGCIQWPQSVPDASEDSDVADTQLGDAGDADTQDVPDASEDADVADTQLGDAGDAGND